MKLEFQPEAEEVLFAIGEWAERRNTPGSGSRFINRFINKIARLAIPKVSYALCKDPVLAARALQCIQVDNWIIAFKTVKGRFIVHNIIHASGR